MPPDQNLSNTTPIEPQNSESVQDTVAHESASVDELAQEKAAPTETPVSVGAELPTDTVAVESLPVENQPSELVPVPERFPAPVETEEANSQSAQIPVSEPIEVTPAPAPAVIPEPTLRVRELWAKALGAIQFRKRKKLEKIMNEVASKGAITNDEVEKLLHVSNATATRYLAILVKERRIRRVGEGRSVRYTLGN